MISRSYILTTVLFLFGLFAYGQTPLDSTYQWAEMEDSVKAISILPIKEPKGLLDSIIRQLIHDGELKPNLYKYEYNWTNYANTTREPIIVKAIMPAHSGLTIELTGEKDSIYIKGLPYLTEGLYRQISFAIAIGIEPPRIYQLAKDISYAENMSLYDAFKDLMRAYHIKVYSITDETGRGVYRVNFARKRLRHLMPQMKFETVFNGVAYFDYKTLRLTQVKGESISALSPDNQIIFTLKKLRSVNPLCEYQIDFGEEDGKLYVKQIKQKWTKDKKISHIMETKRIMQ